MAEVSAVAEVHAHECVAGLQASHEHSHVGLCAAVWLHVDPLCIEQFLRAFTGKVFNLVHNLAAAVVAVSGIAFSILVGQARPHSLHHLVADEVLACYQLDAATLAQVFAVNHVKDLIVSLHFCSIFLLV